MPGATRRGRRRPPATTEGTLPPEGSATALDRRHTLPLRQWPITLLLAVAALGLLTTWAGHFRLGLLLVGAAPLLGALLRLGLPDVGMLAVRSRFTDVTLMFLFGGAIVLLTLVAQPDPWLRVPVLENIGRLIGHPLR
ncbi:hypothetical protein K353_04056 [Kitasatospora sp. SolWspMP-SS2h]|uniref:DUF3017 domain-containing protein n=1 Tax=Kitasatospora sp. SolWspMP-SS2h TaxID=1305729 RepID=UPI000DC00575|nr:DUF3017 domain-containing protein [Kitasatospora sp. SolWspMP-SS2h]RAJ38956.1 hypothetical protein K353_04056 [Kitasatospora sp. SolWspMP-SS2h]